MADETTTPAAPDEGIGAVPCNPSDFCSYFLQQLEGGTTIVPVTVSGDSAFTVFQFGQQRYKITVALAKRVRKPKGAAVAAPEPAPEKEIVPPGAGEDVT